MFKIGDFARLTRISVKTLHHYDEIGLFKPAQVDRFTGYRYYSLEQLPRLNRILVLKDTGFSLEQISAILDSDLTTHELITMLRVKQTELAQQQAEIEQRLQQVQARLHQLEQEGKMSEVAVILKTVSSVTVVGAREVVPEASQMREKCMALHDEVCAYMAKHTLKAASPSLALYHESSSGIDVEMAYYIEAPEKFPMVENHVYVHTLPETLVASVVYHGSYDAFAAVGNIYATIGKWIEANGYQITGANREFYLQTPDWSTPEHIGVMEIQFPVAKV